MRHGFLDVPLAIIGMACRLPGAEDLEGYWRLLRDGASALEELPPERFDAELYYHPEKGVLGKSYTRLGGVVPERPFDRNVCPIPEDMIASSDAVPLAMLEVAAAACRHAGLEPLGLPLQNTGVFIGHARGSARAGDIAYATHVEEIAQLLHRVDAFKRLAPALGTRIVQDILEHVRRQELGYLTGKSPEVGPGAVAGLISRAFGLTGPSMAVDAACASSLVAVVLAAPALQRGDIDMAIVGGASYSNWYSLVLFSHAQALSATGSYPFDARADGFISSDGYAAVLIKTLPRALAEGDRIYGVIRGIGISCDGRGKSLWAPRKEGQIEAIRRAYHADLDPARIQYIEAHGTSTQLGDATELDALTAALGDRLPHGTRLPIGSVKANIGHTRETAGLASLIKVLLAMQHGVIPPAANFHTPNPQIPWERIPFFVPTTAIEWPAHGDGHPRRAAIDAFGIGGLNVHLVVDDSPTGTQNAVSVPGDPAVRRVAEVASEPGPDAIAVIGLGAIFPGARTIAAYWDLLMAGRDPKGEVPPDRWNADIFLEPDAPGPWRTPTALGGYITDFAYDWRKHRIPPRQVETADPLQFMLLDAADQALGDAGYDRKAFDRRRTGVVVGTCFGGDFAGQLNQALRLPAFQRTLMQVLREHGVPEPSAQEIREALADVFLRHHQVIHDETGSYTSSTLASRIARTFDLMGGAFAVDAGEASSLAALAAAADLLVSGACDMVLCAGAQRTMDVSLYQNYASRGMLSADRPRAGFDAAANGFVPGEGVGMVLLKRLDDARRDGDAVRAIVRGLGVAMDSQSPGAAMRLAIQRALASSRVDADDVAVVETVGIGVPHIDAAEAKALAQVYGSQTRTHPLLLGSLVAQIGHTQGASGMASLLKLVLALHHGQMPSSLGLVQPTAAIAERAALRALPEPSPIPAAAEGGRALAAVSAFALRGLAYHVVLERPPGMAGTSSAAPPDWRILRISAGTMGELMEGVARRRDETEASFAAASLSRFDPQDCLRLAIVADSPDALARKLALASEQLASPHARAALEEHGIFYRQVGPDPPRVAFVFSGQGSQYHGMLRELVREVPAAAARLHEIDATMSRLGHPGFAEIAWGVNDTLGADVWRTQVSVLLADTIVHAALAAMGVRPDVISAHSYGEYPALVAAGAWTLEQAVRVTRARCEAIEASHQAEGVLLSTTAPPEVVERLAAAIRGILCVANHNAPDQTVVGGQREAVLDLQSRLASEGFEQRVLPVPRPFHTPLMAEVQEPLGRALEVERILPPRIPLLSSVTNRYVADPLDIRANLVAQLTAPVRYVDLIHRLAQDGVTVFVEVGPRQVLTHLHRRILAERDAAIIAFDHPKRPSPEQLCRVRAFLECAGVTFGPGTTEGDRPSGAGMVVRGAPSAQEIVHFDASARRRQRKQRSPEPLPDVASRPPTAAAMPTDELESFLINFVCEQTGYPPELVELDADLEADLGLDSIKKAQLFGELREHFDLKTPGKLTLEDFPTLRHVLTFLRQAVDRPSLPPREALRGSPASPIATARRPAPEPTPPSSDLCLIRCVGTPYEMGLQHARGQADQIRTILGKYMELLQGHVDNVEGLRQVFAEADAFFTPAGLEELKGMAAGLDMPLEYVTAYNLGLYPEHIAGCTQFAITARGNGDSGLIHGVNEDAPISLTLPESITRIVQVRRPAAGIPHVLFTASGQLGGLNGINARGLGVSSTLLADRPRRAPGTSGVLHPVLVMAILAQAEDIESAVEIVRAADRLGAFSLCLSHHPTDRLCYLEYDGPSLQVQHGKDQVMTTNHCLLHGSQEAPQHSAYRLTRLQQLLGLNGQAGYTLAQAQGALRDRYDLGRQRSTAHPTMNTIRRVDNQVSIVMRPAAGEVWMTPGPLAKEREDSYCRLDLTDVLGSDGSPEQPVRQSAVVATAGSSDASVSEAMEVPTGDGGPVMSRYVLRTAEAALDEHTERTPRLHGPALILGQNPTARALRVRLEELGATVVDLPVGADPEKTLAILDRAWEAEPALRLFLMTARDEDGASRDDEEAWCRRRDRGVLLPYLVCQRWTRRLSEANLLPKATLVAATALGGDFGFSGRVAGVDGGALAGLLKSIRREFQGLTVKVVDAPAEEPPPMVAAAICSELAAGAPETEVAYVRGRRYLVRAVPRPAEPLGGWDIAHGGTWVVTGGGRGITAIVARELGRRFGLRLHLIGKSAAPRIDEAWQNLSDADARQLKMSTAREARRSGRDPATAWAEIEKAREIDRRLRAFAADGVRATYHACDVADRPALARVLDRIRQADGPIHGVIHGAGIEAAARFDRKKLETVRATIASKVDGAAALMALTRADPLRHFVAFGSVSGRFGGHGQTDYAMASDMLCKLIARFRAERPGCASVAIQWPAWDEVGMAMRPESKVALTVGGQRFMPPREGVEHLIGELRAGAPEAEVLIFDGSGRLDLDGTMPTPAQGCAYHQRHSLVASAPVIEGVYALDEGRSLIAEARFHPTADPFLRDHQFQGTPLLPAVIGLEAMAEAAAILIRGRPVVGFRDVQILNGLRFRSGRPQDVRIAAAVTNGGVECKLCGDFYGHHGKLIDPQRVYLRGIVDVADRPPLIPPPQWDHPPDEWSKVNYGDDRQGWDGRAISYGPTLRCLTHVSLDPGGGWGRILAPPVTDVGGTRASRWCLPAAALDSCLVACAVYAKKQLKIRQLPRAFDTLRIARLPRTGEVCTVRVNFRGQEDRSTCFDFTLGGDDGTVILDAEGHHCIILSDRHSER